MKDLSSNYTLCENQGGYPHEPCFRLPGHQQFWWCFLDLPNDNLGRPTRKWPVTSLIEKSPTISSPDCLCAQWLCWNGWTNWFPKMFNEKFTGKTRNSETGQVLIFKSWSDGSCDKLTMDSSCEDRARPWTLAAGIKR